MDNNQNNRQDQNNGYGGNNKNRQTLMLLLICITISLLSMGLFSNMFNNTTSRKITYDKFVEMLENGQVKSVEIKGNTITITPVSADSGKAVVEYTAVMTETEADLTERVLNAKGSVELYKTDTSAVSQVISMLLSFLIPFIIVMVFMSFMMNRMGRGGVMGVGKSKAKAYVQQDTGVTFRDVAGQDEAKESLQEVVDFLHNPGRYTAIGAKLPKGALLVGPPGTGKTLLARAVAGEAKVPFFSLSGSEFVEMFVGVGASRVRDLFDEAKKSAPCIIFIDEIDAIGKTRDSGRFGGNDEREQTLNQLLAEMDGFDPTKAMLILAATNRPEVLDPALLRPGRFDRRIIVDRPDLKGRIAVLEVHSKDVAMDETVDLEAIALATSGAVGSDLANMINEAAINAVKHGRRAVSQSDLLEAVELVLVGKEKKDRILSAEERKIVSYHEVGHALLSALQKNAEPVQKITIIPRTMGALGYVMQVPEEEKYLNTKKELEARLVVSLGGRAAEELVFDTVTTGAANDIEQATRIARAMVTQYGMSDRFGLMGLAEVQSEYLDGRAMLNCGDETATEIDHEVMKMLKASYEEAKRLLSDHRAAMDKIADFLIRKETITGKEFMDLYYQAEGIDPNAVTAANAPRIEGGEAIDEAAKETAEAAQQAYAQAGKPAYPAPNSVPQPNQNPSAPENRPQQNQNPTAPGSGNSGTPGYGSPEAPGRMVDQKVGQAYFPNGNIPGTPKRPEQDSRNLNIRDHIEKL